MAVAQTWSFTPATSGHNAAKAQHTGTEPWQTRHAVDTLLQLFGSTKQAAISSTGTVNTDGTGNLTITITVT